MENEVRWVNPVRVRVTDVSQAARSVLTLFDVVDLPHTATPRERFEAFHQRNPRVLTELERMTALMVRRGRKRIGIKMLFEVLRWNYYLTTDDPDSEYRLNNNYTAYYARLIIARHPEWGDVFVLRETRG